MKIRMAFYDWTRRGKSIYDTPEGVDLSMGHFHSGTVFAGTIDLDPDDEAELRAALSHGAQPVFLFFEED